MQEISMRLQGIKMVQKKNNLIKLKSEKQVLASEAEINFELTPSLSKNLNMKVVERVSNALPTINKNLKYFDRQNSQSTISFMTMTMMSGQSPHRQLRQVMAEAANRKRALVDGQVAHAETLVALEEFKEKDDPVSVAKTRQAMHSLNELEEKINGAFKDIAVLMDLYEDIMKTHNIDDWSEEAFEREEKKFHVRRGFELMYRDIFGSNTMGVGTLEYLEQYGVHPQVAHKETIIYVNGINEGINEGMVFYGNHLEEWLDKMAEKYVFCADLASERMYGKKEIMNTDYMRKD